MMRGQKNIKLTVHCVCELVLLGKWDSGGCDWFVIQLEWERQGVYTEF